MKKKLNFPSYYSPETINETTQAMVLFGAEHFRRAYIVMHLDKLKQHVHDQKLKLKSDLEFHTFINDFFFETLTDAIKICIFFENYMKAVLLSKDYLIHKIGRNKGCEELEQQQKKRPVTTFEFHSVKNFDICHDQKTVQHTALTNQTLTFSTLLSDPYQQVIGLPDTLKYFLHKLAAERNELHFISSWQFEISDSRLDQLTEAKNFVDDLVSRYIPNVEN